VAEPYRLGTNKKEETMKPIKNSKADTHSTARGGVMRPVKALRGICIAACLTISLLLLAMASTALAAGTKVCVPAAPEAVIVTPPAGGACNAGFTRTILLPEAEQEKLEKILPYVKFVAKGVDEKPTIQFSGANIQIISGAGTEVAAVNGEGNVVIGYDETPGKQEGSNNLILGGEQTYTSYGGILAGFKNTINGPFTSVSGGYGNTASGEYSAVSGGYDNDASNSYSSVGGGYANTASGEASSVSDGAGSTASAKFSSVSGGYKNTAEGEWSAISGGYETIASGKYSSVSGGKANWASGTYSWVGGGTGNTASDELTSVSGGESNDANDYASSVSGGDSNLASGSFSSVSGGFANTASAKYSSVSGGSENKAVKNYSAILAGHMRETLVEYEGII
jgi:hypothetical protein